MNTAYYTRSNELYHYGIPGMKWGHRKQRSQTNFVKKTNRYQDRVYKVNSDFAKRREEINNKERSRSARIVTNVLAGPYANRSYASVRAAGGSKNEARAITALTSIGAHTAASVAYGLAGSIFKENTVAKNLVTSAAGYAASSAANAAVSKHYEKKYLRDKEYRKRIKP